MRTRCTVWFEMSAPPARPYRRGVESAAEAEARRERKLAYRRNRLANVRVPQGIGFADFANLVF